MGYAPAEAALGAEIAEKIAGETSDESGVHLAVGVIATWQEVVEMGFDGAMAAAALRRANGDKEAALSYLLDGPNLPENIAENIADGSGGGDTTPLADAPAGGGARAAPTPPTRSPPRRWRRPPSRGSSRRASSSKAWRG